MFKFASAKYQLAFFAVAFLVNIVCSDDLGDLSELGILEEIDVDEEADCVYDCTCSQPYSPLCGSNGKTYGNICQLNTFNRCNNTRITKRSDGTCPQQRCVRDPNPVICFCHRPFLTVCFSNSAPNRPVTCSNTPSPVCGTDGVTYLNPCQLALKTACLGYHVRVCHRGPCRSFEEEEGIESKSAE